MVNSEEKVVVCHICSSDKYVDGHHYDCLEGAKSPETVPLCRRCHRTYHDLGVEWFDDEYLDKAIEVENKRREIFGQPPMRREDVKRSDYWYKKHGIKPEHPLTPKKSKVFPTFQIPHGEPLCGWDWVHRHSFDLMNWVPRIEVVGPNIELAMDIDDTKKLKDVVKLLRGIKKVK